jgi:pimeloyl-ACP methyl ester carboxylesterase
VITFDSINGLHANESYRLVYHMDPKKAIPSYTHEALAFEAKTWATGSVLEDPFYSVEDSTASAPPGTLLKVDKYTNAALFSLPPATALSRIVYQSKTVNGSFVPVSAYILWPHTPRSSPDGYQIVAWSHGTSGMSPNAAPSHMKNLWQHFLGPFQLALQGYVVVATDYAGLGVSKTATGTPIIHEYLSLPSHANDVIYSVEAAQAAFPELSASFVVVGHSQGGGSAWSCAQRQAIEPVPGYLGAVAISPVTTLTNEPEPTLSFIGVAIAPTIEATFPDFDRSEILTPDGVTRMALTQQLAGWQTTSVSVLIGFECIKPGWTSNPSVQKFQDAVSNGGKSISGPLLVVHGEVDPILNVGLTTAAVEKTLQKFPEAQIEYVRAEGASHNGGMTSSQWVWMDWIANRFAGVVPEPGLTERQLKAAMPVESYQAELNWWMAPAIHFYETP